MNDILKKYNNSTLKINLLGIEYYALIKNENNELFLSLVENVTRDDYLKLNKSFKIVNGKINGRDITF